MRLPVNELGQRRPSFSRPDIPAPETAGTCAKCGGHTRAEEFDSWQGGVYARKRTYRCIQHGTKCPAYTVVIGQDGQEEGTVAKTKAGVVTCAQTREWCEAQKAAIVKKSLAYKEVAAAASVSASALAQGLNMHMSLSEATQGRIEQAIANAAPAVAQKVRKERASRKPKQEPVTTFMEPVNMAEVSASIQRVVERVFGVDELLAKAATCDIPTGTDAVRPPICLCGGLATEMGGHCAPCQRNHDVDRRLTGLEESVGEMLVRQKAVEVRVQSLAERAEERFTAMAQGHQLHENRLGRLEDARVEMLAEQEEADAITARRLQELEDRITQTYDHLTEHMANLQPLVVTPQPGAMDALDSWLEEQRHNRVPTPDDLVSALSGYSDAQLAALMTAATARREMLKAMEAA